MPSIESHYDYIYHGKVCDMLKESCLACIYIVPEIDYILEDDFDVIVCKRDSGDTAGVMRYMNAYYLQWVNYYAESAGLPHVKPYVLAIYPLFFKHDKVNRLRVLIHELKHIPESKRGVMPHTGFGDEDTVRLLMEHKPELLQGVFNIGQEAKP